MVLGLLLFVVPWLLWHHAYAEGNLDAAAEELDLPHIRLPRNADDDQVLVSVGGSDSAGGSEGGGGGNASRARGAVKRKEGAAKADMLTAHLGQEALPHHNQPRHQEHHHTNAVLGTAHRNGGEEGGATDSAEWGKVGSPY
jgi:hypothetical protein